MSDTKIAASFRVSVTTRVPRQPESPVAWPWLHFHVALGSCAAAGSAARCSVANLAALAGAYHASGRIAPEAREGLPSSAKSRRSSDGPVQTGPRLSGRGAGPPATEAHREGLTEDLYEHFGPKVHPASVVEIIEIGHTDIPGAEANLHHPFCRAAYPT